MNNNYSWIVKEEWAGYFVVEVIMLELVFINYKFNYFNGIMMDFGSVRKKEYLLS